MQGTYPLFVSNNARLTSELGRMCRPIEGQLLDADTAAAAMDREVRAHSDRGPLFVKFRQARWLADPASRLRHREAAWDAARAALRTDIGRTFCAEAPRMVEDAWAASGMPPRGRPITLRQVVRLARLLDYLYAFRQPRICDGAPARYEEAGQKLRIALSYYTQYADAQTHASDIVAMTLDQVLPPNLTRHWTVLRDLHRSFEEVDPGWSRRPSPLASPAPVASEDPTDLDFRTPPHLALLLK